MPKRTTFPDDILLFCPLCQPELFATRVLGPFIPAMIESVYPAKDYYFRMAQNRACPGVFMFDDAMKVLGADRRAWELCEWFNAQQGKKGQKKPYRCRVPKLLKELGTQAIPALKEDETQQSLDSPFVRKPIIGPNSSLAACAFGLPAGDIETSRLLTLVERTGRREEAAALQANDIFRLTHLLKGWSNKAIAYELKVAEHSGKEHLQRIMAKTKSASRTGNPGPCAVALSKLSDA
jgi:DNA-binding CsgD family transcriptional regulator